MAYDRKKYEHEKVNMHYFTVRMPHDEFAELAMAAGTQGVSIAQYIRECITWRQQDELLCESHRR